MKCGKCVVYGSGVFVLLLVLIGSWVAFLKDNHKTIVDGFPVEYRMPEYPVRLQKGPDYFKKNVSMSDFQIPASAGSYENVLNASEYGIIRYYLAMYAYKKGILFCPGMKDYIDSVAALLVYPYSTDPGRILRFNGGDIKDGLLIEASLTLAQASRDNHENSRQLSRQMQHIMMKLSQEQDCPAMVLFYFCRGVAQYNHKWDIDYSDKQLCRVAANAMFRAFKNGEIRDVDYHTAFCMMDNSGIRMLFAAIYPLLSEQVTLPEYYRNLLAGMAEIDHAWDNMPRSGYYSEEKNAVFRARLKSAGKFFEQSYNLRPDLPEAAGAMIVVETGLYRKSDDAMRYSASDVDIEKGIPDDKRILWFNRCVMAQNDYGRAYEEMIWSLCARRLEFHNMGLIDDWRMMIAFRKALYDSKLYDTVVPLMLIRTLEMEASFNAVMQWRSIFRSAENVVYMNDIFKKYQERSTVRELQLKVLAMETVFNTYSGQYDRAAEASRRLPSYIKDWPMSWYNSRRIVECPNWQMIDNEIKLSMGPGKDILTTINQLDDGKKHDDVAKSIQRFIASYYNNAESLDFLYKRLAECRSSCSLSWEWFHCEPFLVALTLDNVAGTDALLKVGLKPKKNEKTGTPALYEYIWTGDSGKITEMLLEAGCNPDEINRNDHNRTPLQLALVYHRTEVIPVLIKYSKDINRKGDNSLSALDTAIHNSPISTMEEIIAKGADVNQCDNDGWSPLYRAVYINRRDIVEMLLKHGANINLKDNGGKTAVDNARTTPMREFLRKRGGRAGNEL